MHVLHCLQPLQAQQDHLSGRPDGHAQRKCQGLIAEVTHHIPEDVGIAVGAVVQCEPGGLGDIKVGGAAAVAGRVGEGGGPICCTVGAGQDFGEQGGNVVHNDGRARVGAVKAGCQGCELVVHGGLDGAQGALQQALHGAVNELCCNARGAGHELCCTGQGGRSSDLAHSLLMCSQRGGPAAIAVNAHT